MSTDQNRENEVVNSVVTDEPPVASTGEDISTFGDNEPEQSPEPVAVPEEPVVDEPVDEHAFIPNLRIAPGVNYTKLAYSSVPARLKYLPPIRGIGKRIGSLVDNPDSWGTNEDAQKNEEIAAYLENYIFAASKQHSISFRKDGKAFYDRIIQDPKAQWVQGFRTEDNKEIYIVQNNIREATQTRRVTGDAVSDLISNSIGLGVSVRFPLPHTGPHITMSARSTEDYLTLDAQLAIDKRELGAHTVGIIYQNSHIGLVERVCEFIGNSIRRYNRAGADDLNIYDEILVTDLPILQWGAACTMYPDGYPYDIPCSSGTAVCKHIEHVNLDLTKLLWINLNNLSPTQRAKLSNYGHQFTDEDIKIYRDNPRSPFTKRIDIGPRHSFLLKVPTITEYLNGGKRWISEMTDKAKELFGSEDNSEAAMQAYVNRLISLASLREYSSWIEAIYVDTKNEITGFDDIARALEALSNQPELVEAALAEIQAFIEDSTIALIAIPNFACPKCEADYVTDEFSKHPDLVPIDMLKHFFELKDRRLYRREVNS